MIKKNNSLTKKALNAYQKQINLISNNQPINLPIKNQILSDDVFLKQEKNDYKEWYYIDDKNDLNKIAYQKAKYTVISNMVFQIILGLVSFFLILKVIYP